MATTMTQTNRQKSGFSLTNKQITGATQNIEAFAQFGGDGSGNQLTFSCATGGTPNGELTATKGSMHWDTTTALWYVNTDGSTTWAEMGDVT